MQILIIGFQRSGTTLLRRLLGCHPDVRKMFHEDFLLNQFGNRESLLKYLRDLNINPYNDNWGEKTPFYPSIRKKSVKKYTKTWNKYFGKTSRILHIVRHPYDVGRSIKAKYKNQSILGALRTYNRAMPHIVDVLKSAPRCYSFKYEDLLLHPEKQIPKIMNFCQLRPFDYEARLAKFANPKYQKLDPSRAFAYVGNFKKTRVNIQPSIDVVNSIPGTKYKI